MRAGYADWELAGEDQRERLGQLFPGDMPGLLYVRCEKPMVYEAPRLRRIVRDERLDYLICDSISFALTGPAEAAEEAGKYFQAVRSLGSIGTLHVAHISKAEGAEKRPFGSAFWHNGARSTWFVKRAEGGADSSIVNIALYNRKSNLGPLKPAIGYEIDFDDDKDDVPPYRRGGQPRPGRSGFP